MSHSSRILVNMARPFTPSVDFASPEESSDAGDQSSFLEDLLNSPEFIEEQKVILLAIETTRLRIAEDEQSTSSPETQEVDPRSNERRIRIRLTCPICLENLASVRTCYVKMVTQCGHVFCQDCIENLIEITRQSNEGDPEATILCPVCREEIGELRKVYFC